MRYVFAALLLVLIAAAVARADQQASKSRDQIEGDLRV